MKATQEQLKQLVTICHDKERPSFEVIIEAESKGCKTIEGIIHYAETGEVPKPVVDQYANKPTGDKAAPAQKAAPPATAKDAVEKKVETAKALAAPGDENVDISFTLWDVKFGTIVPKSWMTLEIGSSPKAVEAMNGMFAGLTDEQVKPLLAEIQDAIQMPLDTIGALRHSDDSSIITQRSGRNRSKWLRMTSSPANSRRIL